MTHFQLLLMSRRSRFLSLVVALLMAFTGARAAEPARVANVEITLLSTMLADRDELGEWGFSALIVVEGRRYLFDTGMHPDLVLKNSQSLELPLNNVPEVILSHHHSDHTGGLLALREAFREKTPTALATAHVASGMWASRATLTPGIEENFMRAVRPEYEKMGGHFIEHDKPAELYPGVWLTGPIPRPFPERNWGKGDRLKTPEGYVEDNLPEDQALVLVTPKGLVVIVGCGHAGIVNTLDYARKITGENKVFAVIGGLHLLQTKETDLVWTAEKLREFGLEYLMGAHCTGLEPVYRFRSLLSLDRAHVVVGAVGARFTLEKGIEPGILAR